MDVTFAESAAIDDGELSRLHQRAFGHPSGQVIPWSERLRTRSLTWVTAHLDGDLVGFVI